MDGVDLACFRWGRSDAAFFKAEWTGLCVVDGFGHGAARRLGIVVRWSEQSAVFEAGSGYRLIMRYQ